MLCFPEADLQTGYPDTVLYGYILYWIHKHFSTVVKRFVNYRRHKKEEKFINSEQ